MFGQLKPEPTSATPSVSHARSDAQGKSDPPSLTAASSIKGGSRMAQQVVVDVEAEPSYEQVRDRANG